MAETHSRSLVLNLQSHDILYLFKITGTDNNERSWFEQRRGNIEKILACVDERGYFRYGDKTREHGIILTVSYEHRSHSREIEMPFSSYIEMGKPKKIREKATYEPDKE